MLEIVIIFYTGKYFYKLAENYNKSKWGYAILGVITYFVAAAIGGVILMLLDTQFELNINWESKLLLTVLILPFCVAICYLLYFLLKKNWEKSVVIVKDEIQDIGKEIE
ncbi:MAG: hypothetical protein KDC68_00290 [Gelidibacter sp.]|nr:hypothetical protein [Gelidibacter sp.]